MCFSAFSIVTVQKNCKVYFTINICMCVYIRISVFLDLCHHGMVRPQVADGGTASDMVGSCE